MAERQVGTVQELRRYPVKSMAAESLQSAAVSWHGLAGDRRWAFVRPGMERSGFMGATPNPAVLRAIANERNARFGVYGSIVEPGEVRVGDPVLLET